MIAPPLTHTAIAQALHAFGYRPGQIGPSPRALCKAICIAFENTALRLGDVPDSDADCRAIRAELARLGEAGPSPENTKH